MPNHNSQPAESVTERESDGNKRERDSHKAWEEEDPRTANTMGTDRGPEKYIPQSPESESDLPEIEKGSERGARGELLRPSERESAIDIEI